MTELLLWDDQLFHLINSEWQNPFFDALLPILRNKLTWMPLYVFLASFLLLNFKTKGLWLLLALGLTVGTTDFVSSHLIKKTVKRARPCKFIEPPKDVHLLVPCGSGYSFPSSHAANHFAIACFLGLSLGGAMRWVKYALLAWAFAIAFAQVYVGVHYPIDVIAGAMLGVFIAWFAYAVFHFRVHITV